jgi:hypothetical protein
MNTTSPPDDFYLLNDLELCGEYRKRREAQSNAAGGFWSPFLDMEYALTYMKRANDTDIPHFAQSCMELAMDYRISMAQKDYPARLESCIQTTARLLDVLNEMKRRL